MGADAECESYRVTVTDLERQSDYLKQITTHLEAEAENFEDAIQTYPACMSAIQGTDVVEALNASCPQGLMASSS
jgi:exonuclease VII small subunit